MVVDGEDTNIAVVGDEFADDEGGSEVAVLFDGGSEFLGRIDFKNSLALVGVGEFENEGKSVVGECLFGVFGMENDGGFGEVNVVGVV